MPDENNTLMSQLNESESAVGGNASAGLGGFSLADLAAYDTSELNPLMSRLFAAGVHVFRVEETKLSERVSNDPSKPSLFSVNWKMECLEGNPTSVDVDPESLVGRSLTEGYVFWPDQFTELVQLLMGRYKRVGLPYHGALGGMTAEGMEPGWLDSVTGKVIKVRVRHVPTKDGTERAYYDWLPYESESDEG